MISADRIEHWNNSSNRAPRAEHDLIDSLPYPFESVMDMFVGKDVLEIGPGRGRQYEKVARLANSYSICDISPAALEEPIFDKVNAKYILRSYSDEFAARFDVVHFWYVLHHIIPKEIEEFFSFVARHTVQDGVVMFNTPQSINSIGWYTNDGLGTSLIARSTIMAAYKPYFYTISTQYQNERSSEYLFVIGKI